MSTGGSVSHWLRGLRAGDEAELDKLWQRYWPRLVSLAQVKLKGGPSRIADKEDVAQEAFWGFYRSFKAGRVPRLENRNDLWALLMVITAHKAADQLKYHGREKRGGRQPHRELALELPRSSQPGQACQPYHDAGPLPDEQAVLADCYDHFLGRLNEKYRDLADMYLIGVSNSEIAERMGCSKRTAERKIRIILEQWLTMTANGEF